MSIRPTKAKSGGYIRKYLKKGFLLLEALIALAIVVLFTFVIMSIRYQLARWHTQAHHYLQAVSIADRTFERIALKKSIPDTVGSFSIKTSTKRDEHIPYKHIHVAVQWKTAGQEKELDFYGGMVDEA